MAPATALGKPLAAGVAALLAAWLYRRIKRRAYEGLDGIVSFSSLVIAASRAIESQRPDAVIHDPLASILAGKRAMAQAQVRLNAMQLLFRTRRPVWRLV